MEDRPAAVPEVEHQVPQESNVRVLHIDCKQQMYNFGLFKIFKMDGIYDSTYMNGNSLQKKLWKSNVKVRKISIERKKKDNTGGSQSPSVSGDVVGEYDAPHAGLTRSGPTH